MGCHQTGQIAPFRLDDYASARMYSTLSRAAVERRAMPPVNVDQSGACQTFRDATWLTDEEIALFGRWIEQGWPEGEAPPPIVAPPAPPAEPPLEASFTAQMLEPYTPSPSSQDPSEDRCFLLDTLPAEPAFVTGFEFIPGQRRLVRYAVLAQVVSDAAEAEVEALDRDDPRPGWACAHGSGSPDDVRGLGLWAPGVGATRYPEGTGIRLLAGRPLILLVHYYLAEAPAPDQTAVRLALTRSVAKEAVIAPLQNPRIEIPPGRESFEVRRGLPLLLLGLPEFELYGVAPLMNGLGVTQVFEARSTMDDAAPHECLSRVDDWKPNWPRFSFYRAPVVVRADQTVLLTCTYDSRRRDEPTFFGDGTRDERCLIFLYGVLPRGQDLPSY